jgi:uncharacterized FlaG/YvyC family protein
VFAIKNAMQKTLILLGFFLLSTPIIYAQLGSTTEIQNPKTKKYTYQYSFENASSEEVVKATESSLKNLLNVSEVKSKYKADSKKGEFTITVIETEGKSESQELFSPKMIKETFLQHGLKPIEFTVTEEIVK